MPAKNATHLSLLHKVPTCSQVIHKPKKKIPHYSWESAGISALVLYTMSISQTPAFQKLESRWGCCTKQDYSVSQITSKIACNNFSEHLLINNNHKYL